MNVSLTGLGEHKVHDDGGLPVASCGGPPGSEAQVFLAVGADEVGEQRVCPSAIHGDGEAALGHVTEAAARSDRTCAIH